MRDLPFVQGIGRDVRYAVRLFRLRPAMTVSALITIAVGVGLNAIIFNVAHGNLWQELSVPGSERLVYLQEVGPHFRSTPSSFERQAILAISCPPFER